MYFFKEKAKLLEKIEAEMAGISKTLKDIVGAKESEWILLFIEC